jgi:uncharacterized protein (TIGR02588 family)
MKHEDRISRYEWAVAGIGLVLVLSAIAFIAYQGFAVDGPSDVRVHAGAIQRSGDGYLVAFVAENEGGSTVADLEIEGMVSQGDEVETSEAIIDYLPPRAHRSGGLYFTRDPSRGVMKLRVSGFTNP